MSNRIDFFQSAQPQLALPAASVSILVGGRLCPYLEPMEIVRGGWPEFSWARLAYNSAAFAGGEFVAAEDIETILSMGSGLTSGKFIMGCHQGQQLLLFLYLRVK